MRHPRKRDMLQRQALSAIPSFQDLSLDCDKTILTERSGGKAPIVRDSTGNTTPVSQWGGYFCRVTAESRGEGPVSSFSLLFVCPSELSEFFAVLPEPGPELIEFPLPKQCSRNSIRPFPLSTLGACTVFSRFSGVFLP